MTSTAVDYARSQADGADNIAPTPMQGQQAWQYAQSDNFFSPEEQAAVMRKELEPYRVQLEAKLAQIGWGTEHLAKLPAIEKALFSGQPTVPLEICANRDVKMVGSMRIVMNEDGPDLRFTPHQQTMKIPQEVNGIQLSRSDQQQLSKEGALSRPLLLPENGQYVPTFLRVDPNTNTVELWRVKTEQLPTKLMGIDLSKDQQMQLVHGHPIRMTGLIDRQGEPFNATVSVSAATQSLQFSDLNRLDVALKPDNENRKQVSQNNEGAKTDLTRGLEKEAGVPTISNQQTETIKQLLEMEPSQQDRSLRVGR